MLAVFNLAYSDYSGRSEREFLEYQTRIWLCKVSDFSIFIGIPHSGAFWREFRSYVPLEFIVAKQVFKIIESDSGHEILPR